MAEVDTALALSSFVRAYPSQVNENSINESISLLVQQHIPTHVLRSIEATRRTDVVRWITELFPDVDMKPDTPESFLRPLSNGAVLCRLASEVIPNQRHSFRLDVTTEDDITFNLNTFSKFCDEIGVDSAYRIQIQDLPSFEKNTDDSGFEDLFVPDYRAQALRVNITIMYVGIISNQMGMCRIPFRSTELLPAPVAIDRPVEFDSANNTGLKKRATLRPVSTGFKPLRQIIDKSRPNRRRQLTEAIEVHDTWLSLADAKVQEPTMNSRDCVLVDQELMLVKAVSGNRVMVQREYGGSIATPHGAGVPVLVVTEARETKSDEHLESFAQLFFRAMNEEFSDLDAMNFIQLMRNTSASQSTSPSGIPFTNIFVFVIPSHYIKSKNVDATGKHNDERLLAYLVYRLDEVVQEPYSVLYFHSDDPAHQFDFSFLMKAYGVLSRQYKRNLRNLWITHPTIWIRLAWLFCKPFLDGDMTSKVTVCDTLEDLNADFVMDKLELPKDVIEESRKRGVGGLITGFIPRL